MKKDLAMQDYTSYTVDYNKQLYNMQLLLTCLIKLSFHFITLYDCPASDGKDSRVDTDE